MSMPQIPTKVKLMVRDGESEVVNVSDITVLTGEEPGSPNGKYQVTLRDGRMLTLDGAPIGVA